MLICCMSIQKSKNENYQQQKNESSNDNRDLVIIKINCQHNWFFAPNCFQKSFEVRQIQFANNRVKLSLADHQAINNNFTNAVDRRPVWRIITVN